MGFITAIGQRWKKAFSASLTIALLSAVAVVGITLFSSEVLAAWKTSANAEQAVASGTLKGLLDFDAPAATLARFNTKASEAGNADAAADPLLAKNWKFTQTLQDYLQNPLLIYIEGLQLQLIANTFKFFLPNSNVTAFIVAFTNSWLQTAAGILTTTLHLPPVPTTSAHL